MARSQATGTDAPLREELAQLRADIDGLIGTVGRMAESAGDRFLGTARHAMSDAQAQAARAFDTAIDEGRRTLKSSEQTIRAHPFLSIAIAAGIGLLLGRLLASRDE